MDLSEQTPPRDPAADGVVDNPARSRFELAHEGRVVAILDYRPTDDERTVLLPHTVVDEDQRGQGLGAILVRSALDQIRDRGQTVIPQCSFVAEFIDTHPEYADVVAR